MKEKSLSDLQVGDAVIRDLAGVVMPLRVTKIIPKEIHCGDWIFSRRTGAEIDPDLGWTEKPIPAASFGQLSAAPPASSRFADHDCIKAGSLAGDQAA